jgi:hypothetical protein
MTVAHRVAWRIAHQRPLTKDDDIVHTCGNNLCCNPLHLTRKNNLELTRNEHSTESHTV